MHVRYVVEKVCAASAGAIHRIVPIGNPSGFIQAGMNFHDGCRVERVKKEFLGPGPGNLYRFPRDCRQASRFNRLASGALATKSTANIGCNHAYLFGIHSQHFGNLIPCGEGCLGRGPYRHPAIFEMGNCSVWFNGCMRDISFAEGHIERTGSSIPGGLYISAA